MQIGNPTDVKHVAHIGWDNASVTAPSWVIAAALLLPPDRAISHVSNCSDHWSQMNEFKPTAGGTEGGEAEENQGGGGGRADQAERPRRAGGAKSGATEAARVAAAAEDGGGENNCEGEAAAGRRRSSGGGRRGRRGHLVGAVQVVVGRRRRTSAGEAGAAGMTTATSASEATLQRAIALSLLIFFFWRGKHETYGGRISNLYLRFSSRLRAACRRSHQLGRIYMGLSLFFSDFSTSFIPLFCTYFCGVRVCICNVELGRENK